MINLYQGNPGSGKTYEAVCKIIDNLKKGRFILTNIRGFNDSGCREIILRIAGISDYALSAQLMVLDDDEDSETSSFDFWNHAPEGALIVLDESQNIFNSRDWQNENNRRFGRWASTHRHYGYDLVLITQRLEGIDAQVRRIIEWTYHFKKANMFGSLIRNGYIETVYMGSNTELSPLCRKFKRYNKQIFACYKSYVHDGISEKDIQKSANILKHPAIMAIPIMLLLFGYLVSKSSFVSGDLFGSKAMVDRAVAASLDDVHQDLDLVLSLSGRKIDDCPVQLGMMDGFIICSDGSKIYHR